MRENDFFSAYFHYARDTEVPIFFHRWSAIVGLGAFLGRQFYMPFGSGKFHPNIYAMLIGVAGSKKSTAIKMFKKLMKEAGYSTFAADKTTKEKFLEDLACPPDNRDLYSTVLDTNLWGSSDTEAATECFICADEFNDFFGNDVLTFVSTLGNMWDYEGAYESKVKHGKSVTIHNPTISILGGNTPVNFNTLFPPEILGQGFFSRILLIYGESSGIRITFPRTPAKEETDYMVSRLLHIKNHVRGEMTLEPNARMLIEKIHQSWNGIEDIRFDSYSNRRLPHLLKLAMIHCASRGSTVLTEYDVLYTNTVLSYTEHFMPKALGEFGKARNSDVVHKVIQLLDSSYKPMTLQEIFKHISSEVEKLHDLAAIISNLEVADRIIISGAGILLKRKGLVSSKEIGKELVDYSLLTGLEQDKVST